MASLVGRGESIAQEIGHRGEGCREGNTVCHSRLGDIEMTCHSPLGLMFGCLSNAHALGVCKDGSSHVGGGSEDVRVPETLAIFMINYQGSASARSHLSIALMCQGK